MEVHKNIPLYYFKKQKDFSTWLHKNCQQEESIWLRFAKKSSLEVSLSYEEAREVAITYGWIDGLKNSFDEDFYLLKFSPRRKKSLWSKINRDIATKLIDEKKMKPQGLSEVDRAKIDGRWQAAYDSPKNMKVPEWFVDVVKKDRKAFAEYQKLKKSELYSIAFHLHNAKKEATKKRHADKYLHLLSRGEKIS